MIDRPIVRALISAMKAFREEWGCEQLAAIYLTPDGGEAAVVVIDDMVVFEDGDRRLRAFALGELGL